MDLLLEHIAPIITVALFIFVATYMWVLFRSKTIKTQQARTTSLGFLFVICLLVAAQMLSSPYFQSFYDISILTVSLPYFHALPPAARDLSFWLNVSACLTLTIIFGRFNQKILPKLAKEAEQTDKKIHLFKHAYRQLKKDFHKKIEEVDGLRQEVETLYQRQYQHETFGSKSIELYRKIFDSSPIFYIALSEKGEINDINAFACDTLQYSFAELVSSRFLDIVEPEERHRIGLLLNALRESEAINQGFETEFRNRNRERIAVHINIQHIKRGDLKTTYLFCLDISESRELSDTLAHQAMHDDLTGLMNRRALEKYFANRKAQNKDNLSLAMIYFDVDQLKVVNDTCGHTAGDQLLKQLVAVLKPVCERRNCPVFARIGGDEFAIVAPNLDKDSVILLAEALRSTAEDLTFTWDNKSFRQSISVGAATSERKDVDLKGLLSTADAACYSAKEQGRNQVRINRVEEVMPHTDHRRDMLWVARLDKAIRNGEFKLNFQPILKMNKPYSAYVHYEVLLQYIDENGNAIPPGNFLPSAERFGKSTEIDLWVITETFDFLRRNPVHTKHLQSCSINLTSHSIANHRAREAIIALVKAHNFPTGKLCFEITETSAISNLAEAIEFIKTLRSLGCRFALDDFGTGFSSFGYLKNLDVDYLKIDGSFVKDIVEDRLDKAMVRSISEIAKEMGILTIAEYVESDKIMNELKSIGVDLGQGYAIAKPMPIEAIHEFYHHYSPDIFETDGSIRHLKINKLN